MTEMELDERGLFWFAVDKLPKGRYAPETAVAGRLTVGPSGAVELALDGRLSGSKALTKAFKKPAGDVSLVNIQGLLVGRGEYAFLLRAWENGASFTTRGPPTHQFRAEACLIGKKPISSTKFDPTFSSFVFDLEGYGDWLGSNALIRGLKLGSGTPVHYRRPKPLSYILPWGKLALLRSLDYEAGQKNGPWTLSAWEAARIVGGLSESVELKEILEWLLKLEDFLFLLTNIKKQPRWPTVRVHRSTCDYTLYHLRWEQDGPTAIRRPWTRLLDIEGEFGKIFTAWIEACERYGPGFYLYLGTRRGRELYEEHKLVNLVWGLESLHRRKIGDAITNARLKARLERIYAAVADKKDLKWLQSKLAHAAEPHLAHRLFVLLRPLPLEINDDRLREFCTRCATFRNDISHFGGVRSGDEYVSLLRRWSDHAAALALLYHLLILSEIGIEPETIKRIAKQTEAFDFNWRFRQAGLV